MPQADKFVTRAYYNYKKQYKGFIILDTSFELVVYAKKLSEL